MKKRDRSRAAKAAAAVILAAGTVILAVGCGGKEADTQGTEVRAETGESLTAARTQPAAEKAETEGETAPAEEEQMTSGPAGVMTGTVLDAAMNSVVLTNAQYPDGIIFSREDAPTAFGDGLTLDSQVTLFFTGEIKDEGRDTSQVTAAFLRDYREGDESIKAAIAHATVKEVDRDSLLVEAEGKELTLQRGSELVTVEADLTAGDTVTVLYSWQDGTETYTAELIR